MNINQKVKYVRKELFNVLKAIEDGHDDKIIYDSYENYNKSMLDFMKSKEKIWLKGFTKLIEEEIENGTDKESLRKELLSYKGQNKYIINHVVDTIFDDDIIENNESDFDSDDDEKHDYNDDEKIEKAIKNFKWRENQIIAINNTIKQNFVSGVHNQIMGAGKTLIILNTISKHYEKNKNNGLYIITTNRQEILRDLFFDSEGNIDDEKNEFFKKHDIINLDQFKVIVKLNFVKKDGKNEVKINNKIKDVKLSSSKPTIMVVNIDFLKSLDKAECIDYDECNMIIFDECHGVSAPKFYNLIKKIKYENKIPIIGFSATPLRERAESKLVDIFSSTYDEDKKGKTLNIISNYDFIQAIKDDIILPPYYIFCEVNKTLNGKIGRDNKQIMKRVLKNTLELAPYKKVIGWVRGIMHLKEYYKFIKENFPELTIYCTSYCDDQLKAMGYNTNWNEFLNKKNNCILLCVHRGREGCDITNLDTAIYLDAIKKRSLLVALQTSGRVLRPDILNKKTHGLIIDSFVNCENLQVEKVTAEKIINYYKKIFQLCDENDESYKSQKELYSEMLNICQNIEYDETKEEIIVKIDDNEKHNVKFKLELKTKTYDFQKLKIEIGAIIDKMYNVDKKEKFNIIIDKIKDHKYMSWKTDDFWEAYDNISNKDKMAIPLTSKELYETYKEFFDSMTWYDILELDTNQWYQTIGECCKGLKKIYQGEINNNVYRKLLPKDSKLPINPKELYKLHGFKNVEESFNKKQNVTSLVY